MSDSIVIVSGGMDSVTLLHYLVKRENKKPSVLTFTYGQKHNKEVESAQIQTQLLNIHEHEFIDLSFLSKFFSSSALISEQIKIPSIKDVRGDPQPITYVPNRNMIFLSISAAYAETLGVNEIYYGAQAHDLYGYWDTIPEFVKNINKVLSLNRKNHIQIFAPLINMTKAEVLRLGLELEVDFSETWSCYQGKEYPCGTCPTCVERQKAFMEVGIVDPLNVKS